MTNEILLISSAIMANIILTLAVKYLGKNGLICWASVATVLANILVVEQADMFGLSVTLGNVLFASVFTCCELMVEHFGKEEGEKLKLTILFADVLAIGIQQGALLFKENEYDEVASMYRTIFQFSTRSTVASVVCFYLAIATQVKLYALMKDRLKDRYLLRNLIPSVVCNCTENFLFFLIALYGVLSLRECVLYALTTCVIEALIDVINVAFAPLHRRVHEDIADVA